MAAIERVLRSNDCDWHDLAASIGAPAPVREAPRRHRQAQDDGTSTTMDAGDLIDLITTVRDSGAWIGPRSEQFLDGLLERAGRFATVFLTPKQKHGSTISRSRQKGPHHDCAGSPGPAGDAAARRLFPDPAVRQGAARVWQE